jgi:hypothetical protein
MLGELIAQGSGKRNVRRVLATEPVTIEVSFEGKGQVLGIDAAEIGTYTSAIRPDGSLYGEAKGVVITAEGDALTWKGAGVGTFGERGAVSYRGAIYYHSASPKFARLNTVAGVFEFHVDEAGNTQAKVWEWK